jgi:hypothetical protein
MNRTIPVLSAILLVVLVAVASRPQDKKAAAGTPDAAVRSFFEQVKNRNWSSAYSYVSPSSNTDQASIQRELGGKDGSLRTYSTLQEVQTKVLHENDAEALVRANLQWSTAVGASNSSRDVKVVREDGSWKVYWPSEKQQNLPPQVIPVNYLRWDIIRRGPEEDWGAQNVEAPKVRIISMNAIERDGRTIVMGEIVNEDTVPGFVSVGATLLGADNKTLGEESSFDKISHVLLPKEVSPFRIDFPGVKLADVKNVRMTPNSLLVPASADPVIGVLNQRIEKDARGHSMLRGELINQSGQTVNIPHVLATYYDNSGKVIWVADAYVDRALVPQTPVPFTADLREDVAGNVQNYRVTVNHYSLDKGGL